VVSARMRGWKAESCPDLPVRHHRRTSSAGGLVRNSFRAGLMDHSLGYHPAYELMKRLRRAPERPFMVGAAAGLAGFAAGYLRRSPRVVSADFVSYIRRQQMERLTATLRRTVVDAADPAVPAEHLSTYSGGAQ
jgi:hypothetical protein